MITRRRNLCEQSNSAPRWLSLFGSHRSMNNHILLRHSSLVAWSCDSQVDHSVASGYFEGIRLLVSLRSLVPKGYKQTVQRIPGMSGPHGFLTKLDKVASDTPVDASDTSSAPIGSNRSNMDISPISSPRESIQNSMHSAQGNTPTAPTSPSHKSDHSKVPSASDSSKSSAAKSGLSLDGWMLPRSQTKKKSKGKRSEVGGSPTAKNLVTPMPKKKPCRHDV